MRKRFILLIFAGMLVFTGTAAAAAPPAPTGVGRSCGEPHLIWWTDTQSSDHVGHKVYRQLQAFAGQPFNSKTAVKQDTTGQHSHALIIEPPQAKTARYTVTAFNAAGEESVESTPVDCVSDVRFVAGAETTPTFGIDGEWSAESDASSTRTNNVTTPKLKGSFSYECFLQEGDDSFGERCEYSQGNTSASNIDGDRLYHEGDDLWTSFAVYIPSPGFAFCTSGIGCAEPGDGGSIDQKKQLGSCGTPALSIPASWLSTTGLQLKQSNSATNGCESQTMKKLWVANISFNTWAKVLQRVKFSTSASVGFLETFVDADGDAINDFVAISASGDGLAKTRQNVTETIGGVPMTVERIYTHTMKSPTDQPSPACVGEWCSHQRIGVYRGGATASINGNSTIWHDSVAAGPTVDGVIQAAF